MAHKVTLTRIEARLIYKTVDEDAARSGALQALRDVQQLVGTLKASLADYDASLKEIEIEMRRRRREILGELVKSPQRRVELEALLELDRMEESDRVEEIVEGIGREQLVFQIEDAAFRALRDYWRDKTDFTWVGPLRAIVLSVADAIDKAEPIGPAPAEPAPIPVRMNRQERRRMAALDGRKG